VVLPDGEHEVEELWLGVAIGERAVRLVGNALIGVQLVGRSEQARFERIPTVGLGPGRDAGDLLVGDAEAACDRDVLAPLIGRPAIPPPCGE